MRRWLFLAIALGVMLGPSVAMALWPFVIAAALLHIAVVGGFVYLNMLNEPEMLPQGASAPATVEVQVVLKELGPEHDQALQNANQPPTSVEVQNSSNCGTGISRPSDFCNFADQTFSSYRGQTVDRQSMEDQVTASALAYTVTESVTTWTTSTAELVRTVGRVSDDIEMQWNLSGLCSPVGTPGCPSGSWTAEMQTHVKAETDCGAPYGKIGVSGNCEPFVLIGMNDGKVSYHPDTDPSNGQKRIVRLYNDGDPDSTNFTIQADKIERTRPHGETVVTATVQHTQEGKVEATNKQENVYVLKHDGGTTTATVIDKCTYTSVGANEVCSHSVSYADGSDPHPDDILPGSSTGSGEAGELGSILKGDADTRDDDGQTGIEGIFDDLTGKIEGITDGTFQPIDAEPNFFTRVTSLFSVGGSCPALSVDFHGVVSELLGQFCNMWDNQGGRQIMGFLLYILTLGGIIFIWSGAGARV